MPEPLIYKHSFNAGDLLTVLPAIKNQYRKTGRKAVIYQNINLPSYYGDNIIHHPVQFNGDNVCMNEEMFFKLKPLIDSQRYVEEFRMWKGERVDFDIDITRHERQMPMPGGDIHYWPTMILPQLTPNFSEKWITVQQPITYTNHIIINRTERYRNPFVHFFFLREIQDRILFAGTPKEYDRFCKENDLQVSYLLVRDFKALAESISGCAFFVGNQSMCWHIADGLQVPRIVEICATYPNTFPKGRNGYAFAVQNGLEHYFYKLLKEADERQKTQGENQ